LGCGREVRTPAVQAGFVKRRLSFGYTFTSTAVILLFVLIAFEYGASADAGSYRRAAA